MNMFTVRRGIVAALVLAVTILGGAGTVAAHAAAPHCGITWASLAKDQDVMSSAPLSDIRTGQHPCFDRVVFDFQGSRTNFQGPASGYHVAYADNVYGQGKGDRLSIAGGARLSVVLLDPAYDIVTGAATYPHATGDHVADVSGFRTLRDVVYGGSFEGSTTVGIGVRARLPFRVLVLEGPGAGSRIVVDVAHRWSA
jgi:hypothetical protein